MQEKNYFLQNCSHNSKAVNANAYFVNRQAKTAGFYWDGIGYYAASRQDGSVYTGTVYGNTAYSGSLSDPALKLDDLMGTTLCKPKSLSKIMCKTGLKL